MQQEIIHQIPVDQIISRPQVRQVFNPAELAELAQSVKEAGIQQPIRVRPEGEQFVIVIAERRWRASKLAGLDTIPAIIADGVMTEAEILQAQLVENLQRADLSPREKSNAIQRLISESKMTAAQVASKLGLSAPTVTKLLSLIILPESILSKVDAGSISLSGAYELSQVVDPLEQQELAERMASGQLTRDGLVAAKKMARLPAAGEPTVKTSRVILRLDANRRISLVGPGLSTVEDVISWLEEFRCKARKLRAKAPTLGTFTKILKEQAKA